MPRPRPTFTRKALTTVPGLAHSDLTAEQREFVSRVDAGLKASADPAMAFVLGDGSASPNGEKFVAELLGHSFNLTFDFGVGRLYRTSCQLPVDWRSDFAARRAAR